ncbi:endolysin [Propionibacterium phage Anatole]|uniref:N-acetylmuramoyl-L-alanine amidase n=2 Tax=Anatolevirus anatole TaxID=2169704 RepID=A0A1D8ET80_9CAUD|nr:endolysin [Propionibacterium phage Anatole]AOT24263.1 endolysin [Propionibacterium phage Anatole]AOT24498.1 endolysin [Propionibacterium phage E1]
MDWTNLNADVTKLMNVHFTPGREGHTIDKIVIHHNGGNLSIDQIWNVWQDREASAHYQVQSDGRIGQLVNDWDTAWHAGDWDANLTSIGIEHADDSTDPWHVSDAAVDAGAHLVAALCRGYNLGRPEWMRNVFPHSHFSATSCPASLAENQRADYMARAQAYFDGAPVTGRSSVPAPAPAPAGIHVDLPAWTLPAGNFYGSIDGGEDSHGGYYEGERPAIAAIQRWLIRHGYAGAVDDSWADGLYEQPTVDAVTRFQRAERPNSTDRWGEVWADDLATMAANNG